MKENEPSLARTLSYRIFTSLIILAVVAFICWLDQTNMKRWFGCPIQLSTMGDLLLLGLILIFVAKLR